MARVGGGAIAVDAGEVDGGKPDAGLPDAAVELCVGTSTVGECNDGSKNGSETAIDCGGPTCSPCTAGQACVRPRDCSSGICSGRICQIPIAECSDLQKNGTETDIDCGGAACLRCEAGQQCTTARDCASYNCTDNRCEPASCVNSLDIVWTDAEAGCLADLARYKLYTGTISGVFAQALDVELDDPDLVCAANENDPCERTCGYYLYNRPAGSTYVTITTVDGAGNEGPPSDELTVSVACDGC